MEMIEIKNEILKFGSDSLRVFGGIFEGGKNIQQVPDEISKIIYELLNQNKKFKNFIEVGSAAGGNTFLFNHYFNFENIVIVDDNQHPKHTLRKSNLENIKYIEYIGNSQSSDANKFIKDLNIKFDIMIIDADHSYEGVKKDTYNYIEFLNQGGFLIFHDTIACDGVKKWVNEINEKELGIEKVIDSGVDIIPRCGLRMYRKL